MMTVGLNALIIPNVAAGLNDLWGFPALFDMVALISFLTMVGFMISSISDMKKERIGSSSLNEPLLI